MVTKPVRFNETLIQLPKDLIFFSTIFHSGVDSQEKELAEKAWKSANMKRYPSQERWDFGLFLARHKILGENSKIAQCKCVINSPFFFSDDNSLFSDT